MQRRRVHTTFLSRLLWRLTKRIDEPLYRGLGDCSLRTYKKEGILRPRRGSLATGTGICWTNDPDYALSFAKKGPKRILLVSDLEHVSGGGCWTDTRCPLAMTEWQQCGEEDPYVLWNRICEKDTVVRESPDGPPWRYTYVTRLPMRKDRILYEIQVEARP